jgi:leader peptidase (prepilin peptidase)/N-methyltransferase
VRFFLAIPWEVRVAGLFVLGAMVGSLVNLVVDRARWETPRHSPWNKPFERLWRRWFGESKERLSPSVPVDNTDARSKAKPKGRRRPKGHSARPVSRPWLDRVPIVGWLALSRLSPEKGAGFWVRPMLVELLCAFAFAGLYAWEVGGWRMVPDLDPRFIPPPPNPPPQFAAVLHWQYLAHVVLISFMLAASLIDLDEWIIPDAITVPGTLAALALAVGAPASTLISDTFFNPANATLHWVPIQLATPLDLPASCLGGQTTGLLLALGCVGLWCFWEMPRTWRTRRGLGFAVKLFVLRLVRERWTRWVLLLGAAMTALVVPVWWWGGPRWTALLSALVGMAVGGAIIWVVRIVCSAVLRKEAMGFGDVTVMAMIGAFLGWQACVLVFFLSPFFGLIPPLVTLLARRGVQAALPYGPFLCAAAATVLLCWAKVWPWLAGVIDVIFVQLGVGFALALLGGAVLMMVLLLALLQLAKRAFGSV